MTFTHDLSRRWVRKEAVIQPIDRRLGTGHRAFGELDVASVARATAQQMLEDRPEGLMKLQDVSQHGEWDPESSK